MFGLNKEELVIFKKLSTPHKIQDFLDTLPINWENNGETYWSPRLVLRERQAHCFEGALLAATALWLHGQKPLLLDLKAHPHDDDHVVVLFKCNGHWGAISKTNHASLRWRDPVYRTVRELALSYFHEYFLNKNGQKILHSYSKSFDLSRHGQSWITAEENLDHLVEALDLSPHYQLVPKANKKFIRPVGKTERLADQLIEWPKL